MTARLIRSAFGLALLALTASACIDENILDQMADNQPKANRYRESKFYDDGLTMKAPPEGTVPRERITLNAPLTTGREPDGPIQSNGEPLPVYLKAIPVPVTRKLLDLGRKRYDITCGTCHGPLGDGDSIVAHQMSLRPPPSLHNYRDRPPGYIYDVITHGFGMMASYAGELPVRERWAVVAYIRALQISQNTPLAKAPPEAQSKLPPPGAPDEPEMPKPASHAPHEEAP